MSESVIGGEMNGMPKLVPGPRGGMLKTGGTPGNPGNPNATGRPKSQVRELCLNNFAEQIQPLNELFLKILSDPDLMATATGRSDLMKIAEINAKYSGLASIEVDHTATVQVNVVYDETPLELSPPEDTEEAEAVDL